MPSSRGRSSLSIALLVAMIVAALWIAARIYRAGVLLYGQRPGVHGRVAAHAERRLGLSRG